MRSAPTRTSARIVPAQCTASGEMIPHHATALNLSSVLEYQATIAPERIAISCAGGTLTYDQLNAAASQVAGGLVAMGIGVGDHVALSCPNLPSFPIAYFGIL